MTSTKQTTKSPQESPEKWLEGQLSRLRGAFGSFQAAGELTWREYNKALRNLAEMYGREKVAGAITKIIETIPNFVPAICDLQNFIPMPERKYCSKCAPQEGWEYVWEENCKYPKLRRCRHKA